MQSTSDHGDRRTGRINVASALACGPVILKWTTDSALILTLTVACLSQPGVVLAHDTIDPNDDGSQYAWAENIGWWNAEPMGDGGPGARIWVDRAEGWIWLENAGWISLSCANTSSCSTVAYGVTNDGAGFLAGFAWSENAGWISFACENTSSCTTVDYGVVVNPGTGELSGWAWSENLGWISFSCDNTGSCATVDYRVETEVPFVDATVFADGFESGNTSQWDNTVP